jgi:hypothetical protein
MLDFMASNWVIASLTTVLAVVQTPWGLKKYPSRRNVPTGRRIISSFIGLSKVEPLQVGIVGGCGAQTCG